MDDPDRVFLRKLARAIREERARLGLLQEQLGARAGIAGSRIGEIERANVNTSIVRVQQIARALGVPLSRLLASVEVEREPDFSAMRSAARADLDSLPPADLPLVAPLLRRLRRSVDK